VSIKGQLRIHHPQNTHIAIPMSELLGINELFDDNGNSSIRLTPGIAPRASIIDFVGHVTGDNKNYCGQIISRIKDGPHGAFFNDLQQHQFSGRGEREQCVLTASECLRLVHYLPGPNAKLFVQNGCQLLTRIWAGDLTLLAEIEENSRSDAPAQQFARNDVENNMGGAKEVEVPRHTEQLEREAYHDQMIVVDCGYEHTIADYDYQIAEFRGKINNLQDDTKIKRLNIARMSSEQMGYNQAQIVGGLEGNMKAYEMRLTFADTEEERKALRDEYAGKAKKIADNDVGNEGTAALIASRGVADNDGMLEAKINFDIAKKNGQDKRKAESDVKKEEATAKKATDNARKAVEKKEKAAAKEEADVQKRKKKAGAADFKRKTRESHAQDRRDAMRVGRGRY
jgi:hypothetical protein